MASVGKGPGGGEEFSGGGCRALTGQTIDAIREEPAAVEAPVEKRLALGLPASGQLPPFTSQSSSSRSMQSKSTAGGCQKGLATSHLAEGANARESETGVANAGNETRYCCEEQSSELKLCQKLRRYPPTLTDATDARIADFRRWPTPTDARKWLPKQVRYRTAPRPVSRCSTYSYTYCL